MVVRFSWSCTMARLAEASWPASADEGSVTVTFTVAEALLPDSSIATARIVPGPHGRGTLRRNEPSFRTDVRTPFTLTETPPSTTPETTAEVSLRTLPSAGDVMRTLGAVVSGGNQTVA